MTLSAAYNGLFSPLSQLNLTEITNATKTEPHIVKGLTITNLCHHNVQCTEYYVPTNFDFFLKKV